MSELRVAVNLVPGTLIYGHTQIVYVDDFGVQTEIEVQGELTEGYIIAGEWTFPAARIHDTYSTPYFQETGYYYSAEIDLGDRSADAVWNQLLQLHNQFVGMDPQIDYDLYKNSNSYVTSLLSTVGINIGDYSGQLINGMIAEIPGIGVNVLEDANDAIPITLIGSGENDVFKDGALSDTLYGGEGDDTFFLLDDGEFDLILIGQGNDIVIGGGSEDRLALPAQLVHPGLAAGLPNADMKAIPLLGGFADIDGEPGLYRYVPSTQSLTGGQVFIEIDSPETTSATFVYDDGPSPWSEFNFFEEMVNYDAADNPITADINWKSFDILYILNETDLIIYLYYSTYIDDILQQVASSVTISDFEEGDFGIQFYDYSTGPDGTKYIADTSGVNYIHNGGIYVDWFGIA